jgi:tetratricopeptide (TPR) repeat protein
VLLQQQLRAREQLVSVRLLLAALLALAAATTAATAQAAPKRPPPVTHDPKQEKEARAHFDRAEKAFNLGRFDEALAGYQAAYEVLPLPAFLFNIAQCHRNLRNREQAIFFYQRYLSLAPDAPNRPVVEELIADQKRQLDAQKPPPPPTGERAGRPLDLTARPQPGAVAGLDQAPAEKSPDARWKSARWWLAGALGAAVLGGVAILAFRGSAAPPAGQIGVIDGRR